MTTLSNMFKIDDIILIKGNMHGPAVRDAWFGRARGSAVRDARFRRAHGAAVRDVGLRQVRGSAVLGARLGQDACVHGQIGCARAKHYG